VAEQGKTMSKAMTRKAWLEYLQKAVDEFDWEAAGQEQGEPVAWMNPAEPVADFAFRWVQIEEFKQPVYTTPQPAQKPWVGLTDEEIADLLDVVDHYNFPEDLIVYTQAKLKEKNT